MAFIKFYSIVDAKWDPESKTVSIQGEMDITGDVYALIAEGYLEDFCTHQSQLYTFDMTDRAEFNYCINFVNKQVGAENKDLPFTQKLSLLKGKTMVTLIDNQTVREQYAQYMKEHSKNNDKGKGKKK